MRTIFNEKSPYYFFISSPFFTLRAVVYLIYKEYVIYILMRNIY